MKIVISVSTIAKLVLCCLLTGVLAGSYLGRLVMDSAPHRQPSSASIQKVVRLSENADGRWHGRARVSYRAVRDRNRPCGTVACQVAPTVPSELVTSSTTSATEL